MSKHVKRIKKIANNPKNALVLGTAFGNLSQYVNAFSTVFIFSNSEERIRNRHVVYRDTIDSLKQITDVDVIFVDAEYFDKIHDLNTVWRKSHPVILTQGSIFTEKKIQKFLNSENYTGVERTENYIIWKTK